MLLNAEKLGSGYLNWEEELIFIDRNLVQQLEALVAKIGGSDGAESLREQIADLTSTSNHLSKDTNGLMKKLVQLSNEDVRIVCL